MLSLVQLRDRVQELRSAPSASDVFGPLTPVSEAALSAVYRPMAVTLHPDRFVRPSPKAVIAGHSPTDLIALATEALGLLNQWRTTARSEVKAGTYGQQNQRSQRTVKISGTQFELLGDPIAGDIADIYWVSDRSSSVGDAKLSVLKVARSADDNDLMQNEVRALSTLWAAPAHELDPFHHYLPKVLDRTQLHDGRRATRFKAMTGYVPLDSVITQASYVDCRTAVWMFRRVLEALIYAHHRGIVHGAVLPPHVMVHPSHQGAKLLDWCYSVNDWHRGGRMAAIPAPYRSWYPGEVFDREAVTPSLDLYLAALTVVAVSGGDVRRRRPHIDTPRLIRDILSGCLLERPSDRFSDAATVYERLNDAALRAYGHPTKHDWTHAPTPPQPPRT